MFQFRQKAVLHEQIKQAKREYQQELRDHLRTKRQLAEALAQQAILVDKITVLEEKEKLRTKRAIRSSKTGKRVRSNQNDDAVDESDQDDVVEIARSASRRYHRQGERTDGAPDRPSESGLKDSLRIVRRAMRSYRNDLQKEEQQYEQQHGQGNRQRVDRANVRQRADRPNDQQDAALHSEIEPFSMFVDNVHNKKGARSSSIGTRL